MIYGVLASLLQWDYSSLTIVLIAILLLLRIKEYNADDGHTLATPNIYEYLWRVMYNRRSKMNPLWNTFVLGGVHKGEG